MPPVWATALFRAAPHQREIVGTRGKMSFSAENISGLMAGKRGLIMGVANDKSIAWGIARTVAAAGAEVAFTYQGEALEKRVRPLAESVGSDTVLPCDVTDEAQVEAAFGRAAQDWGHLDAIFNNAGIGRPGAPIDEIPVEEFRQLIDINVTGSFICARAAFGIMRKQEPQGGRIINNGSVSAYVPRWGSAPYTASKHAITGLTRSISLDGRPFNIACGQIDIGNAATPMTDRMVDGVPQPDGSMMAEPRMDVDNVGQAIVHMDLSPIHISEPTRQAEISYAVFCLKKKKTKKQTNKHE